MSQYLPVHTLVFAFWVIMVDPSPISSNDAVQGPSIILLLQQTTGDKQKKKHFCSCVKNMIHTISCLSSSVTTS